MEFALKTRVVVGAGEHEKLGTYLSWRSALIVAGRNVQATGAVEAVEASLKKAGSHRFLFAKQRLIPVWIW